MEVNKTADSLAAMEINKPEDLVMYVPIHNNFGQVEHTAAFLAKYKTKLFVYDWNTAGKKMVQFYSNPVWKNIEEILSFSIENLLECLEKEKQNKRQVVFLLTSSVNYSFGLAQKQFFGGVLKKLFPTVIRDVFSVGHCLYGCQSCGMNEHQIPVYFTRFFNNQLPYSKEDVRALIAKQKLAQHRTRSILICPSIGLFSYLTSPGIINTLVEAQKNLGNFLFMVKLHSFCYLENHPLSGISPIEGESVELLKKHFVVIDESQHNILPLLSEFDAIISDLDSSVTFETLYFPPKPILAYYHPEQELPDDPQYLSHLHPFSSQEELSALLVRLSKDWSSLPVKDGREFFKSKYGEVNGKEVERIESLRGWYQRNPTEISTESQEVVTIQKVVEEAEKRINNGEFNVPVTVVDYLAMGLTAPPQVVNFDRFVKRHLPQLETIGIPKKLWMSTLDKLSNEIFDAGLLFELNFNENSEKYELIVKEDIQVDDHGDVVGDGQRVYLVDHAWTTEYINARTQLKTVPGLVDRLVNIMNLDLDDGEEEEETEENSEEQKDENVEESADQPDQPDQEDNSADLPDDEIVDRVWGEMWKYLQTYRLGDEVFWYFMDEVGSAISHNDSPNFKCMPFYFIDKNISFSLLWPVQSVKKGDVVTRDFYPNPTKHDLERKAHLTAWMETPREIFEAAIKLFREKFEKAPLPLPPSSSEFSLKTTRKHYKVYTNIDSVKDNLKMDPHFPHVADQKDADILWLEEEFKNFPMLHSHQIVNQFPWESCVVFKHMLPLTVYNSHSFVNWLPLTFNMETQLGEFVGEYQKREEAKEENYWIVKPWNRARSIDMVISNNLSCLLRMSETGPKVISKYIERPILYEGRKFDLRYIVLVKSIAPLELYVYNMFWIRLANLPFSLDSFETYEKHFTVMNYSAFKLQQLHYKDFIRSIEDQYSHLGVKWGNVQEKINKMFRGVFEAASNGEPPLGYGKTQQARAMYGIDIMIDEGFEPKLLEINFNADTKRACVYDPDYYNNVFSVLFLNEGEGAPNAWTSVTKI